MHDLLGLPPEASAHAHDIDLSIALIHIVIFVLFAGWSAFYLIALFRFRRSRNPHALYSGLRSRIPYIVVATVAVVELTLLLGFDMPLWARIVSDIPPEKDAVVVRIVAEQFAWNVHYPGADGQFGRTDISLVSPDNPIGIDRSDPAARDDLVTINLLTLPVGKPVIVYLSSKDVIHSFSIPFFRVKQDVIPGQLFRISFTPTKTSDEIQAAMSRMYPIDSSSNVESYQTLVSMREYRDGQGSVILGKGDPLSQDAVGSLARAGIREVLLGPFSPIEIACAQLCGLGHYRMKATVDVVTPDQFTSWMKEQTAESAP